MALACLLPYGAACSRGPEPLPEGVTPLAATFENGLRLEGVALKEGVLEPGQKVSVTLYFRAAGPVAGDPLVQLYLTGDCPGFNLHGADLPLVDKQGAPPSRWKPGALESVKLELTVPERIRSGEALFWAALARGGNERYRVTGGAEADLNGRALVARRPVNWRSTLPVPALEVPVLGAGSSGGGGADATPGEGTPIAVDGQLTEPAWARAAMTSALIEPGGTPAADPTTARLIVIDRVLYVGIEAADTDLFSPYRETDDPVSFQDAVVLILRPDAGSPAMVELAVSPRNVVRDTLHPMCREGEQVAWSSGARSAVAVDGTLEDPAAPDRGYTVELAIPAAGLEAAVKGGPGLLEPGHPWTLQILQYDSRSPYREAPVLRSWAPLMSVDPWTPTQFGRIEPVAAPPP